MSQYNIWFIISNVFGEIMPIILRIDNFTFFFYSNEGNPLKSPHIHVRSAGCEAKISLVSPFAVLLNSGYSASDLRAISRLVLEKQEILLEAYRDYFA